MSWLIFTDGVKRTAQTDLVIAKLEPYFEKVSIIGRITSVLRDSTMQLATIQDLAVKNNLVATDFKLDFIYMSMYQGKPVPYWQIVWSTLLSRGVIVNPPIAAVCLMDYTAANGVNKKGMTINETPHHTGLCFDTGARIWLRPEDVGDNSKLINRLDDIYQIILQASSDGVGIIKESIILEHSNNCCHAQILG